MSVRIKLNDKIMPKLEFDVARRDVMQFQDVSIRAKVQSRTPGLYCRTFYTTLQYSHAKPGHAYHSPMYHDYDAELVSTYLYTIPEAFEMADSVPAYDVYINSAKVGGIPKGYLALAMYRVQEAHALEFVHKCKIYTIYLGSSDVVNFKRI